MSDDTTRNTGTLTREQEQVSLRRTDRKAIDHHTREWASGTRGGGKVPGDLSWPTNPKQQQEETGSATFEEERELTRERSPKR